MSDKQPGAPGCQRDCRPICFSDKISLDPSLSSEMSLGLLEIECLHSLRNTDCLKGDKNIIEKNHVPFIINTAGSSWIEVVRFCCVDFCGVTIRSRVGLGKSPTVGIVSCSYVLPTSRKTCSPAYTSGRFASHHGEKRLSGRQARSLGMRRASSSLGVRRASSSLSVRWASSRLGMCIR